jgi:EAL domain-containing protein (putative c-di-GMP-specific phosphodiesterase class I)
MGKSLSIPVLAEGIETAEQLETLRREGWDEAQGFLLGYPAPMSASASIHTILRAEDECGPMDDGLGNIAVQPI